MIGKGPVESERPAEPLRLGKIVTVIGDHFSRWHQVFKVLDEAIESINDDQQHQAMRNLRSSVDGRAN